MQTTSKFMPPLYTPSCFTVQWFCDNVCVLSLVAYLWKVSSHHPAPLPTCSIYSAQVPWVWTRFSAESACRPSPVLLRPNVTWTEPHLFEERIKLTCSMYLRSAEVVWCSETNMLQVLKRTFVCECHVRVLHEVEIFVLKVCKHLTNTGSKGRWTACTEDTDKSIRQTSVVLFPRTFSEWWQKRWP